jgi:coenzyme F420-reducing hydrogenase delta subunit
VKRTKDIIAGIGIEPERVGIIVESKDNPKSLTELAGEILEDISRLGPSPVHSA